MANSSYDIEQRYKNRGRFGSKKPIQVATRCSAAHTGATRAGTVAGTNYRWSHVMNTECSNLQFVFTNFYPTVTTESSNANAITIQVALEYNGLVTRLHFNGEANKTLDQGGMAMTDPIMRNIPKGATFFTRVWVSVPVDGNLYPTGLGLVGSSGEGKTVGASVVNATGALGASAEDAYGPAAIVGVPYDNDAVAFALVGDSMVGDINGDGWPVLAVQDKYGYMILSRPGSDVTTMEQNSGNVYRQRLLQFATHAIVTFGANDWNLPASFVAQEGYIKQLWDTLDVLDLVVYHSVTTPRSTSSDAWATVQNQTTYNGNSYDVKRKLFNANLRGGKYPVKVLDAASAVETFPESGIWKPGFTGDGIHPLASGKTAIINAIALGLD